MLAKLLPHKRDRLILFPAIGSQLIVSSSLFLMPVLIGFAGATEYKLAEKSGQRIVGTTSSIELSPQEEASWIPMNGKSRPE